MLQEHRWGGEIYITDAVPQRSVVSQASTNNMVTRPGVMIWGIVLSQKLGGMSFQEQHVISLNDFMIGSEGQYGL